MEASELTIRVNGRDVRVRSSADAPLLWVLRDELALTGTKFGCGKGLCGACTVLADGKPIRSCMLPLASVGQRSIRTIEGTTGAVVTALRGAWEAESVPQCGYCQAGQLMSATALLASTRAPTDAQIDTAMRGNICRCGTYARIRAAIHWAARTLGTRAVVP